MVKISNTKEESKANKISQYRGVRKRKWGKWVSEIRLPNSRDRIWLGSYDSPEKAARAFDAAQFCLRGKSGNFNFPDHPPVIAGAQSMTPAQIQAVAAQFANIDPVEVEVDVDVEVVDRTVEEESCSPSISDATSTVQMDSNSSEVAGVDWSFHEELGLMDTLGSGNYGSEFGFFTGFDDFTAGDILGASQPGNFDSSAAEGDAFDFYDASLYQDLFLWNF